MNKEEKESTRLQILRVVASCGVVTESASELINVSDKIFDYISSSEKEEDRELKRDIFQQMSYHQKSSDDLIGDLEAYFNYIKNGKNGK